MEDPKIGGIQQPGGVQQPNEPAFQNAKKVGFLGGIEILGTRIRMAFKGEKEKNDSALKVASFVLSLVKDDRYMESAVGKLNHMNNRQLAAFNALLDKDTTPGLKERVEKLFAAKDGKLVAHQNITEMKDVKPLGFLKSIWHGVSNWRSVAVSMAKINAEKQDTTTEVGKMYQSLFAKTVVSSSSAEQAAPPTKLEGLQQAVKIATTQLKEAFLPNLEQFKATQEINPEERDDVERYNQTVKQLFNTLHTAVILGDPEILEHHMKLTEGTRTAITNLHEAITAIKDEVARAEEEEEAAEFQPQAQPKVDVALYIEMVPPDIQAADKEALRTRLQSDQVVGPQHVESSDERQPEQAKDVDEAYAQQVAKNLEKSLSATVSIERLAKSFMENFERNPNTKDLSMGQLFDIAVIAANGPFQGHTLNDDVVAFANNFHESIFNTELADSTNPEALYKQISGLLLEKGAGRVAIPTSASDGGVLPLTDESAAKTEAEPVAAAPAKKTKKAKQPLTEEQIAARDERLSSLRTRKK